MATLERRLHVARTEQLASGVFCTQKLTRSNVIPQGADAKRMLFFRYLVDTGKVSDDRAR